MERQEAVLYYIGVRDDAQEEGYLFINAPINSVYLQEIVEQLLQTHGYRRVVIRNLIYL